MMIIIYYHTEERKWVDKVRRHEERERENHGEDSVDSLEYYLSWNFFEIFLYVLKDFVW